MNRSTSWLLGLLTLFLSILIEGNAYAEQSPLLELTHKLHCTQSEQEASGLLAKLSALPTQPFGLPSENLGSDKNSQLYAETVDILLQVLHETIQHYPKLQESTERVVLSWNYCAMMTDGKIADLGIDTNGEALQRQTSGPFPAKQQGFSIWGFLKVDPSNRYVPKITQSNANFPRAQENFVFRLYQQQCFPHPDTGNLVNEVDAAQQPSFGNLAINKELAASKSYPYSWKAECSATAAAPVQQIVAQAAPQPATTAKPSTPAQNTTPKPVVISKPVPAANVKLVENKNAKPSTPAQNATPKPVVISKPVPAANVKLVENKNAKPSAPAQNAAPKPVVINKPVPAANVKPAENQNAKPSAPAQNAAPKPVVINKPVPAANAKPAENQNAKPSAPVQNTTPKPVVINKPVPAANVKPAENKNAKPSAPAQNAAPKPVVINKPVPAANVKPAENQNAKPSAPAQNATPKPVVINKPVPAANAKPVENATPKPVVINKPMAAVTPDSVVISQPVIIAKTRHPSTLNSILDTKATPPVIMAETVVAKPVATETFIKPLLGSEPILIAQAQSTQPLLIAPEPPVSSNIEPVLNANADSVINPTEKPEADKTSEPVVDDKQKPLDLTLPKNSQPAKGELMSVSPSIATANSNASVGTVPLPPEDGIGLAGNFYHRAKLTGALSVGANVSWKPYSNFFVRSGVNYGYYPSDGKFSYSWGLGYDDWHPGTVSVQLNNWGPILPRQGLDLRGAVANVGYKFEADFLRPYNISGSAAVTIPLKGDPSISTTWNWSPVENWFIRATLQRKFGHKGGWDWSYNFGYSDWHPFTFSLTYDNWGSNPIFDGSQGDSFNFKQNGAISLSWSWAF